MKRLIYIILLLVVITSCKTRYIEIPVKEKIQVKVIETVHDTTIITSADSTWFHALIKCQDGKPVLQNPKSSNDKPGLKSPKVSLDPNGKLSVDCEKKAEELFLQWKSQHKEILIENEVPIYIEKPLSRWKIFFLEFGKYAFFLIIILLVLFGSYKMFKK